MSEPTSAESDRTLVCDTCGATVDSLRRDVVDADYNALNKPPLWNCDDCYRAKRTDRKASSSGAAG